MEPHQGPSKPRSTPFVLLPPRLLQPDKDRAGAVASAVDAFNQWLLPSQIAVLHLQQAQQEQAADLESMDSASGAAAAAATAAGEAEGVSWEESSLDAAASSAGAGAVAADAGSEPQECGSVIDDFICDWLMRGLGAVSLANCGGVPAEVAEAAAAGGSQAETAGAWLLQVRWQHYQRFLLPGQYHHACRDAAGRPRMISSVIANGHRALSGTAAACSTRQRPASASWWR